MGKDDIRFIEMQNMLYEYRDIEAEIEDMELELSLLKYEIKECGAIDYSQEKSGRTYKINKPTEEAVISKEQKINDLSYKILKKENLKKRIENALRLLDDYENKIIELRYFNRPNLSWESISDLLNISRPSCIKKHDREIIPRLVSIMFH